MNPLGNAECALFPINTEKIPIPTKSCTSTFLDYSYFKNRGSAGFSKQIISQVFDKQDLDLRWDPWGKRTTKRDEIKHLNTVKQNYLTAALKGRAFTQLKFWTENGRCRKASKRKFSYNVEVFSLETKEIFCILFAGKITVKFWMNDGWRVVGCGLWVKTTPNIWRFTYLFTFAGILKNTPAHINCEFIITA